MRSAPLLASLAVLLTVLAGCSGKPGPADADGAMPLTSGEDLASGTPGANATRAALQFAGGFREFDLPIEATFAPTDMCLIGSVACPRKEFDLTPVLPADVPVELSIALTVNSNFAINVLSSEDVSVVQMSRTYDSTKVRIDALLVRGASGTVTLDVASGFTSIDAAASGGPSLSGSAHSVVRHTVAPAYVPVGVELRPGEAVNATGDGLEQFVAYSPSGVILRDTTAPFGLRIPETAPGGTYVLFAVADEAVRIIGPAGRTLTAHRLQFTETEPIPLESGAPATWEMPVPGLPVFFGVVLESREDVPDCCSVASFAGSTSVTVKGPGNADVITASSECLAPLLSCSSTLLGYYSDGFYTDYLDESLVPGTYTASVTTDQARSTHVYSVAGYIA